MAHQSALLILIEILLLITFLILIVILILHFFCAPAVGGGLSGYYLT